MTCGRRKVSAPCKSITNSLIPDGWSGSCFLQGFKRELKFSSFAGATFNASMVELDREFLINILLNLWINRGLLKYAISIVLPLFITKFHIDILKPE